MREELLLGTKLQQGCVWNIPAPADPEFIRYRNFEGRWLYLSVLPRYSYKDLGQRHYALPIRVDLRLSIPFGDFQQVMCQAGQTVCHSYSCMEHQNPI